MTPRPARADGEICRGSKRLTRPARPALSMQRHAASLRTDFRQAAFCRHHATLFSICDMAKMVPTKQQTRDAPPNGAPRAMFGSPSKELPQHIAFLLVPNFSMIAFTSAIEPLRLANRASGKQLYPWHLFSPDGKPIAASNGIELTPEGSVDGLGNYKTVILCSGIDAHLFEDRNVFAAAPAAGPAGRGYRRRLHRRATSWPAPACWTAIAAPSIGRTSRASARVSRRSTSPPNCSRSTATASPAPAAPPRST